MLLSSKNNALLSNILIRMTVIYAERSAKYFSPFGKFFYPRKDERKHSFSLPTAEKDPGKPRSGDLLRRIRFLARCISPHDLIHINPLDAAVTGSSGR